MEGNEDSSCVFAPEIYIADFTQFVHPVHVKNMGDSVCHQH